VGQLNEGIDRSGFIRLTLRLPHRCTKGAHEWGTLWIYMAGSEIKVKGGPRFARFDWSKEEADPSTSLRMTA
jgi:hypothetical protein